MYYRTSSTITTWCHQWTSGFNSSYLVTCHWPINYCRYHLHRVQFVDNSFLVTHWKCLVRFLTTCPAQHFFYYQWWTVMVKCHGCTWWVLSTDGFYHAFGGWSLCFDWCFMYFQLRFFDWYWAKSLCARICLIYWVYLSGNTLHLLLQSLTFSIFSKYKSCLSTKTWCLYNLYRCLCSNFDKLRFQSLHILIHTNRFSFSLNRTIIDRLKLTRCLSSYTFVFYHLGLTICVCAINISLTYLFLSVHARCLTSLINCLWF